MPESHVGELFLSEQRRRVQKDRTVTLDGVAFEVDAALVRDHVTLRYDPAKRHPSALSRSGTKDSASRSRAASTCSPTASSNATTSRASCKCPSRMSTTSPEGLSLRELVDPSADLDDEERLLMYRKHFALTRHPFDKDLAADDLFASASLAELNARLKHLVEMRGIGLVTGDSGSGNTTTCRHLVAGLRTGLCRVMYVSMTTGNVMDVQIDRVGTGSAHRAKP